MRLALILVALLTSGATPLRVGSKSFTEAVILGELASQSLRADGFSVEHRRQLGGTRVLWSALLAGQLDVYAEYTGTLSQEIFGGKVKADVGALRTALQAQHLGISTPLGFENTYALGMLRTRAAALGLSKISGLATHPELELSFSNEFLDRQDGWPALARAYGLKGMKVRGLDHDLAYRALESGAVAVTDLYSTDAEIRAYDLAVLEDDRRFFPDYRAVFIYRDDLPAEAIARLNALGGTLSQTVMVALNASVKLEHQTESQAAAAHLARSGVHGASRERGLFGQLLKNTADHLFLVGTSLAAAIAVAIPLGVFAARRRRLGVVVMGVTGILQTVPSLALLVFMIPLLGIGARPAIAALFLYSLLPIVRNTHAGLTGIPGELTESAEVLGLRPWTRLWRVELPLASRSILAGIKTAAVINVGTATLGALIGAGGYGQPILTGIRLNRIDLILQGAIPSAVLALGVQGLFAASERVLVSPGLRTTRESS